MHVHVQCTFHWVLGADTTNRSCVCVCLPAEHHTHTHTTSYVHPLDNALKHVITADNSNTHAHTHTHTHTHTLHAHELGSCRRLFSLRWKMSSTNTPFLPRQRIKKQFLSRLISKCFRLMKREFPMLTSTSPSLLFRPIKILRLVIRNSELRPSSLA